MDDKNVKIVLTASDKTGPAFKSVEKSATGLQKDVSGLAKVIAGTTVAIGGMAVAFGVSAVKSAMEAQNSIAQLNAVLKSTGNAAGLTAEEIKKQASAFQDMTTYSDEAVMSAQNLLLTFTNIKGPIFKEATQAVLDMSTALGQDLKSSSVQLGKALQDPIEGVSALRRVGVNFNETQQEMIKNLVESGKTMEAQKFILNELSTEFGGSAAAAAGTFHGQLMQIMNAFDELKESIGGALIESIEPFISRLNTWSKDPATQVKLTLISEEIKSWSEVIIPTAIDSVTILFGWVEKLANAMIKVGETALSAYNHIARLRDIVGGVIDSAGKAVGNALSGKRASGGPVSSGSSYLVGEQGPEIFSPKVSGNIIPNGRMAGVGNVTINVYGNTLLDEFAGEKVADQIMRAIKSNLRL